MTDISNTDDVIDFRNVIARIEAIEDELADLKGKRSKDAKAAKVTLLDELQHLADLADDLKGYGGDEQWRGDWYPVTLIRDSYFRAYAEELAEDIGAINRDATWPNNCIAWEKAARELQMDYSEVEFDGVTYWYR